MALTETDLERIAAWCDTSVELSSVRRAAWHEFFGTQEAGIVDYHPDLGELASRQRRFLGWFMFQAMLPNGQHPAEFAARRLFENGQLSAAVRAFSQARYVMAVVSSVMPGRGVLLELEEERFEIRSRTWARLMRRDAPVFAHLIPIRPGVWLPGPGWIEWPISIGSHMRAEMRGYQTSPIEVERSLQGRSDAHTEEVAQPRDETLAAAVSRMTEAATREGRPGLVRSELEWTTLVLQYLEDRDFITFAKEVMEWIGQGQEVSELNRWMALAQNIWNATPQPDREGRSAYELASQSPGGEYSLESWHN